jgi:glutamate carboxypeptidase
VFLIGLEPALDNGDYVSSRSGVRWYDIHVHGKESHAGAHHDEGINACYDLAVKLSKIQELTNYKKGATVSIGSMMGGKDKFNIVCGEASARVDTRAASDQTAKVLVQKIDKILKSSFGKSAKTGEGTHTEVSYPVDTPPLSETKASKEWLKKYIQIVAETEGRKIRGEPSGGVADLNQMARPGMRVADGMGPIGGGAHTAEEFLTLTSLKTRAFALSSFLDALDAGLK